jgi:hypothetical protein
MKLALLPLICCLALAIACSGDDDAPPTPTLFPELEATAGPTAVPPAVPTQLPTLTEVPAVIWLIDVSSGNVVTLDADPLHSVAAAWFDEATNTVVYQPLRDGESVSIRVDLDGTKVEQADYIAPPIPTPAQTRWQLEYVNRRELEDNGIRYVLRDASVLDTQTGERRTLATDLYQCIQCDAFSAPQFSPSGRYVFYREHGGENRVFLSDLQAATTRDLTTDRIDRSPVWSPAADLLLRPSEDGNAILEDVAAGTQKQLPDVPWPADFDPTGAYIYTLTAGPDTVIADGTTGAVIATLDGSTLYDPLEQTEMPLGDPPISTWSPVVGTGDGFVAAITGAAGCHGTLLYLDETPGACIEDAGNPVFSPDGSQVILARKSGQTGPVDAPNRQSIGLDIYDVIIVDVATGDERVLAEGALGFRTPPQVVWNAAGTHILVRWPYDRGP